jgi:peptidoglycan/xylan/chitin deacetylase (PgdA/CDA1 family)
MTAPTSLHDVELSVVIPTHRRPALLAACIESLARQRDLSDGFEVIVVLDGADQATEDMLASLATPFPLRVIVQEQAGAGSARNHGAAHARAPYLLFLDDDVVAAPSLVAAHLVAQPAGGGVVGIGRIDKMLSPRPARWARSRQLAWRDHYDRLAAGREARFTDCYGGNLCVPRTSFAAVGGFAEDIAVEHDVELGYRLARAGNRFAYVPDAVAREEDRDTLRHYLGDAQQRGVAAVALYERHPALLPDLRLGGAGELGRRWVGLRRLLMAIHMPPMLLGVAGSPIASEHRSRRWYGFLFSYCYWRGVRSAVDRATWRRLRRGSAILMYHAVGDRHEQASRYVVPERRFKRQMAWLRLRRYNVILLEELVACLREHRLPPAKSVVVTFDDGYLDNAELALPVLRRFGFPATVFLVSAADGVPTWICSPELRDRPLLGPAHAKQLIGSLTFGAHSRTHPPLTKLGPSELEREVSGSRAELESALDLPVTTFAYPFGDTSPEVEAAVARAGFLAACTVTPGRNRAACNPMALKRIEVKGTDSLLRFAFVLWLGDKRSPFRRLGRSG